MRCLAEASIDPTIEFMTNRGRKEITNKCNIVCNVSSLRMTLLSLRGISRMLRLFFTLVISNVASVATIAAVRAESGYILEQKKEPDQPNMDGLVEVSFKVDATGKIQIVHINSTSPQLTEYVVKKLSKIKLDNNTGSNGKVITYRFVFKKQA